MYKHTVQYLNLPKSELFEIFSTILGPLSDTQFFASSNQILISKWMILWNQYCPIKIVSMPNLLHLVMDHGTILAQSLDFLEAYSLTFSEGLICNKDLRPAKAQNWLFQKCLSQGWVLDSKP